MTKNCQICKGELEKENSDLGVCYSCIEDVWDRIHCCKDMDDAENKHLVFQFLGDPGLYLCDYVGGEYLRIDGPYEKKKMRLCPWCGKRV